MPTSQVGYLHRGFEKECETGYYYQNIPYTDRLNYSSPILNNVGYCMAVEKLFDIVTPPRCDYLRVIARRVVALADHMLCIGASAMELAAFTPMLYLHRRPRADARPDRRALRRARHHQFRAHRRRLRRHAGKLSRLRHRAPRSRGQAR